MADVGFWSEKNYVYKTCILTRWSCQRAWSCIVFLAHLKLKLTSWRVFHVPVAADFVLFSLHLLLLLPRLTHRAKNNHVRCLVDLSPATPKLNDKIYVLIGLFSRMSLFCSFCWCLYLQWWTASREKRNQILFHQSITRRTTVMKVCKLWGLCSVCVIFLPNKSSASDIPTVYSSVNITLSNQFHKVFFSTNNLLLKRYCWITYYLYIYFSKLSIVYNTLFEA